jgi:hypothetical protein
MVGHQFVQGLWYDYKLEIHSCPNKQLNFNMETILNTDKNHLHMPTITKLYGPVPLGVFHWLKEQMEEILVKLKLLSIQKLVRYQFINISLA